MQVTELTRQLADTKREWEQCRKKMAGLREHADKLRGEGANEAQANFLVYGDKEAS